VYPDVGVFFEYKFSLSVTVRPNDPVIALAG